MGIARDEREGEIEGYLEMGNLTNLESIFNLWILVIPKNDKLTEL